MKCYDCGTTKDVNPQGQCPICAEWSTPSWAAVYYTRQALGLTNVGFFRQLWEAKRNA